ncbi:hypothetical protein KJ632_00725 [Patescibacteria group bacterium]|nr:hypothetical protein [Patescibacteria group bacterium]
MEFTLSLVGMALIILSWIVQIGFSLKGSKEMRPCFAGFQFLGIALLVVDAFLASGGMTNLAWMNVLSAIGALVMLGLVLRK